MVYQIDKLNAPTETTQSSDDHGELLSTVSTIKQWKFLECHITKEAITISTSNKFKGIPENRDYAPEQHYSFLGLIQAFQQYLDGNILSEKEKSFSVSYP